MDTGGWKVGVCGYTNIELVISNQIKYLTFHVFIGKKNVFAIFQGHFSAINHASIGDSYRWQCDDFWV